MPDWDEYIESHPFDANPLREGNVNHFVSHYDRLGLEKSDWLTTTQLMLDGGRVRNDSKLDGEDKCMVNFISFKECVRMDLGEFFWLIFEGFFLGRFLVKGRVVFVPIIRLRCKVATRRHILTP